MRLVITDDEGEENDVLTGIESYDWGNPIWRTFIVAWIQEALTKGEENDG